MREADVGHDAVAEERAGAGLGAVEELVRDHDVLRRVLLLQAADRAGREDALDAELLEAVDVGAEVQLGRHHAVAGAVTRQERHALAAQRRRARSGAEGSPNGVVDRHISSRSVSPAMSYRPLPPMMPIWAGMTLLVSGKGDGRGTDANEELYERIDE